MYPPSSPLHYGLLPGLLLGSTEPPIYFALEPLRRPPPLQSSVFLPRETSRRCGTVCREESTYLRTAVEVIGLASLLSSKRTLISHSTMTISLLIFFGFEEISDNFSSLHGPDAFLGIQGLFMSSDPLPLFSARVARIPLDEAVQLTYFTFSCTERPFYFFRMSPLLGICLRTSVTAH